MPCGRRWPTAVAHRDYHPAETIQLRIFDDRRDANPGGLLAGLTLPDLLRGGITPRQQRNHLRSAATPWLRREEARFGMVFIRRRSRKIGARRPVLAASPTRFPRCDNPSRIDWATPSHEGSPELAPQLDITRPTRTGRARPPGSMAASAARSGPAHRGKNPAQITRLRYGEAGIPPCHAPTR